MSYLTLCRSTVCRATLLGALALLTTPVAANAGLLTSPAEPLATIGSAEARPSCDDRYAPRDVAPRELRSPDIEPTLLYDFDQPTSASELDAEVSEEFDQHALHAELRPALVICSPTFPGVPGAVAGTTAAELRAVRVGPGWRELGATADLGASLRAGDRLTIPAVDANAVLRVHVASEPGGNTSPVRFTDLSHPSTLTVDADERGLAVRLTRTGGGAVSESVVTPPRTPAADVRVTGTFRRWQISSRHLPGSAVAVMATNADSSASATRASATGVARTTLPFRGTRKHGPWSLLVLTSNWEAQSFSVSICDLSTRRRGAPRVTGCDDYAGLSALESLLLPLVDRPVRYDAAKAVAARLRARLDAAAASRRQDEARPTTSPAELQLPHVAPATRAGAGPGTLPHYRLLRSSPALRALKLAGLHPLQDDLNGDGQPEFWTDNGGWSRNRRDRNRLAGYLLISSPRGLVPRRVVIPDAIAPALQSSELSSIGDVTGDGLGELVVDLGERHAIVPGSRELGRRSGAMVVRRDGNTHHLVIAPMASSPGAPYTAVDDATGDGRRELLVLDDTSAPVTLASQRLAPSGVLSVPGTLGRVLPPDDVVIRHEESAAPKGDPAVRAIGGRIVTTRWKPATSLQPGTATFSVSDALGHAAGPPVSLTATGNPSLLDYDRGTGDLLVWVSAPGCLRGRCAEAVLRLAADGTVKQLLESVPRGFSFDASSARFMSDGPDADHDPEILLTWTSDAFGVVPSAARGTLSSANLLRRRAELPRLGGRRYQASWPARAHTLVAADGRRTTIVLATPLSGRSWLDYRRYGSVPVELRW